MNDSDDAKPNWLSKLSTLWSEHTPTAPSPHTSLLSSIAQAESEHSIGEDTARMMRALLGMTSAQVRDNMIPRGQITLIEENWSMEKVLAVILESGHSRYPVVDADHQSIRGILIAKDLLPILINNNEESQGFMPLVREAFIVPESKALDAMLNDFRTNRNHMALVMDEYGNLSGLITIEDVIEEIVGEIDDEHDEIADAAIIANTDGSYQVKALTLISEFNQTLNTNLSDEDADTLGGFISQFLGKVPSIGEEVIIEHWRIRVTKANQRRALAFLVEPLAFDETTATEATSDTPDSPPSH